MVHRGFLVLSISRKYTLVLSLLYITAAAL